MEKIKEIKVDQICRNHKGMIISQNSKLNKLKTYQISQVRFEVKFDHIKYQLNHQKRTRKAKLLQEKRQRMGTLLVLVTLIYPTASQDLKEFEHL